MASAEEPPLRRVLLAGGTSVMGKVFIEELLQHPHGYEVGVLTRASSAPSVGGGSGTDYAEPTANQLVPGPHGQRAHTGYRTLRRAAQGASKQAALDGLKAMGATVVEADYASADALAPSLQGT